MSALEEQLVLINCSWPCPNPAQSCIVTSTNTSCGNRGSSDQWMMNSPKKSPFYTGAYITVNLQLCQPVPIPTLPTTNSTATTGVGQSIIEWPIASKHKPQDEYLGNCGHGLYCSSIGQDKLNPICRQKLDDLSPCNSSNQCLSRYCFDSLCQANNNITKKGGETKHHNITQPTHNSTGKIIAAVLGVFGAILVIALVFFIYRKRKHNKKSVVPPPPLSPVVAVDQNNNTMAINSTSTSFNINHSNHDLVHKQFASDFQQESITPPAPPGENYLVPPPLYKP
jgi:hypothetical protein